MVLRKWLRDLLVSVIMNCFNGEKYLHESINSVLNQTYRNLELIFWDNQSNDRSAEYVKSYDDPRIKYFYAPKHTLLYEARNHAIEKSIGEYIAILDVDDWWEVNKLELQLPHFNDASVGLTCGNYKIYYEDISWWCYGWKKSKPSGMIFNDLLNDYHIGLLTIIIRRQAFFDIGGFDSRYHVIGDMDFSMRLAEQWKIKTLNQALANFRKHATNESELRKDLFVEEMKIWTREAKVRVTQIQKKNRKYGKNNLLLRRSKCRKKGDYMTILTKLYQLFHLSNF